MITGRVMNTNDDKNIMIDHSHITGKISHIVIHFGNLINDS